MLSHGPAFNNMMRAIHRSARIILGVMPLETEKPELVELFIQDMRRDETAGFEGSMNGWPIAGGPMGLMYDWYPRFMAGPHMQCTCGGTDYGDFDDYY